MQPKIAAILIGVFGLLLIVNLFALLDNALRGRHASLVPLLGGMWGAIGFALTPRLRSLWWIPILIEPGTVILFFALPYIAIDGWKRSRFNLLATYRARDSRRQIAIKLFQRGVYTLVIQVDPEKGELGMTECGTTGNWRRDEGALFLEFGDQQAVLSVMGQGRDEWLLQSQGVPSWESKPDLSLGGLHFERDEGLS